MIDVFTDPDRLAVLEELALLTDTQQEGLDRYTRLAAAILAAPVTLFTVVVGDTQYFRSQVGLEEPLATERQTPRSHSFCQYVVLTGKPLEVVDAREHPVVRDNPAIDDLGVIAYLGMPIVTRKGECVGSLCALEHAPREWKPARPRRAEGPGRRLHDGAGAAAHDARGARARQAARRRAAGAPLSEAKPTSILRPLVEELHERRARARLGGGEERIARQHEQGKLTARERLELLIDPGTFTELGIHAGIHHSVRGLEDKEAPADGVITGYGRVDGRMVAVAAYDFTVMAGSMGMTGEMKVARLRDLALTKRMPFVWLLDSAGARIQEAVGSLFAGSGHLFREEVVASGVIPQVAALMGPCAAGTAYIPGLADFVPMVRGRGSMALAGPHLVRAAVGEDVTQEELGGSRVHCRKSGVGDLEVADDEECIARIRQYLSFFPSHCEEAPPRRDGADPADRMDEELLDVLPESNRKPYDMYDVIRRVVDDGEWLDLKPQWAKTIITCLARMGGRPVGIVANQPRQLGGILDNDSADKAARFVNLCNAFGIPLVFLMDVPGFMVGTKVEAAGIIRHGAKMLYAVANATVPKVTVVLRKAYGAGYYVMNGRAYEPDLIVAWPTAEISVMGAEGAVEIVFRKQVEEAEDPAAKKAELIEAYRKIIDVYIAARNDMIDDVIDPRETRPTIIRALEMAEHKRIERPWKRHGIVPV